MTDPVFLTDQNAQTYGIPAGDVGAQLVQDAQVVYDYIHAQGMASQADIVGQFSSWDSADRVNAAVALLQRMGRLVGPL